MVILSYVGLDIGGGGGKISKTVYAVISDDGNMPVLIDVDSLGLDGVPKLLRRHKPKSIVIDAPLSWDIDISTGFRRADVWLRQQIPESLEHSVMATNSMQAVPVRGLHFAMEFIEEAKKLGIGLLIAETHPTVSLYRFLSNFNNYSLSGPNLSPILRNRFLRLLNSVNFTPSNTPKAPKNPLEMLVKKYKIDTSLPQNIFSFFTSAGLSCTPASASSLLRFINNVNDDTLDAVTCALVNYSLFHPTIPWQSNLNFFMHPEPAKRRSFGELYTF